MIASPSGDKQRGVYAVSFRGLMDHERGIALMMVLWVLVLLSILSLNFLKESRLSAASARNLKEETLAYCLALSGYHEAVNYLLADKDITYDFIDGEGNFWIDKESQPVTGSRSLDDGEVEIRITDEDARLNINIAPADRLKKIFDYAGVSQDVSEGIVDSILDWRDTDEEHHLSGAEGDYYEGLEDPYPAKNGFFDVPEELLLVKGVMSEYAGEGEEKKPFVDLITTFSKGNININTVSKEVMELLGLNPIEIETVMKQRTKETAGFRFIPQEFVRYGLNATASQNFRIEVTARMHGGVRAVKITAVVSRQPAPEGYRMQTVYWRERAEDHRG